MSGNHSKCTGTPANNTNPGSFEVFNFHGRDSLPPVEVFLISEVSNGDQIVANMNQKQRKHPNYINEYNEESAKILNSNFQREDPTAVYSFSVGKVPLVFHRHEGHRVIFGVTGSGGSLLVFSTASPSEISHDPQAFVDQMFEVKVPPNYLFTLRFNGQVWHQFGPLDPSKDAFAAISCHTNELGGNLPKHIADQVIAGKADIPMLTEPIPASVEKLLQETRSKKTSNVSINFISL